MHLKVIDNNSKYILISLSGRLDMAGVKDIEISFAEQTADPARSILLDMTEVPFIASMGLRMLLSAAKRLHAGGNGRLILVNTDEMVREVIKMAGVETFLGHAADLDDALAELGK